MPDLLIVNGEPEILRLISQQFADHREMTVLTAMSGADAMKIIGERTPDVAIVDLFLPDQSGMQVFDEIKQLDPKLPIILITSGGTSSTAIEAMTRGAFDYLVKPLNLPHVRELVDRAITVRRLMHEPVSLDGSAVVADDICGDALVGRCAAMQEVYKAIGRVAPRNVTVLIRGESGTGKELVARAIYQFSARSHGPFLAVNCAAIPDSLLESELFGHEKGAFTGADRRRIGKFEQCSGGTLFLDEIGDMPLTLQSKILRVLQDQRFERVGGNETVQTDVRIITATNRDLEQMGEVGAFRLDLYYRLNVYGIELPPLRERQEDLPLLINYFLDRANQELDKEVTSVAPDTLDALRRYLWPGNVRELESVLKQAVLKSSGSALLLDFLPGKLRITASSMPDPAEPQPESSFEFDSFVDERLSAGADRLYDEALSQFERRLIARVLQHTDGNQVQAAKLLGISRSTLRSKIRQLGISIGRTVDANIN